MPRVRATPTSPPATQRLERVDLAITNGAVLEHPGERQQLPPTLRQKRMRVGFAVAIR